MFLLVIALDPQTMFKPTGNVLLFSCTFTYQKKGLGPITHLLRGPMSLSSDEETKALGRNLPFRKKDYDTGDYAQKISHCRHSNTAQERWTRLQNPVPEKIDETHHILGICGAWTRRGYICYIRFSVGSHTEAHATDCQEAAADHPFWRQLEGLSLE